jgi:hypothetical protein
MIDLTSKFGRKVKRHLKNEKAIWLATWRLILNSR